MLCGGVLWDAATHAHTLDLSVRMLPGAHARLLQRVKECPIRRSAWEVGKAALIQQPMCMVARMFMLMLQPYVVSSSFYSFLRWFALCGVIRHPFNRFLSSICPCLLSPDPTCPLSLTPSPPPLPQVLPDVPQAVADAVTQGGALFATVTAGTPLAGLAQQVTDNVLPNIVPGILGAAVGGGGGAEGRKRMQQQVVQDIEKLVDEIAPWMGGRGREGEGKSSVPKYLPSSIS